MNDILIKVCGLRDGENIRQVARLGVDYIGMIFYPKSPRYVSMVPTHAGIMPDRSGLSEAEADGMPKKVGVFVDDMPQNIVTRVVNYGLDVVQLHGHEQPTLIRNLRATLCQDLRPGLQFWKVISVESSADLAAWRSYADCVDAFLFDTKTPLAGGSGRQFDWSVLADYDGDKPFLLSGGIGPDDVERLRNFSHPRCMGIDLNSRFETEPGLKDTGRLKTFIEQIRNR